MREEPIISRAVLKAALVLLVAAGLGGGAYALAKGGIDLPDIDLETTTDEVTTVEDTTLEDTTIGGDEPQPGGKARPIPDAALEAQRLNDCIRKAGDDTDAVFACFDEFQ